jgi:periplasmic protein TonB
MNRVQKKCLLASAALHGLLLLVLVFASAFQAPRMEKFDLPLLDVIPARTVEAAIYGGGDPAAQPPPPAPTPAPATPPPQPKPAPQPKPEPTPQPQPKPEVVPAPAPKPITETPKPTPKPAPPKIQVNSEIRRTPPAPQPARTAPPAQDDSQRRAAEELAQRATSAAARLSQSLSSKTTISIPGPGGAAFANYGQVVISIYERNWIKPENIDKTFTVRATVVIARDGKVVSTRITQPSANRLVNDSVERVLDRVKFIAPFPEGSTDATQSFNLNFELKPGNLTG